MVEEKLTLIVSNCLQVCHPMESNKQFKYCYLLKLRPHCMVIQSPEQYGLRRTSFNNDTVLFVLPRVVTSSHMWLQSR